MIRVDTSAWFRGIVRVYDERSGKMIAECECSTTEAGISGLYVALQAVYLQGKLDGSDAVLRQLRRTAPAIDGSMADAAGGTRDGAPGTYTAERACAQSGQGEEQQSGGLGSKEARSCVDVSCESNCLAASETVGSIPTSPVPLQVAARHPAGAPRSYEGAGHLP